MEARGESSQGSEDDAPPEDRVSVSHFNQASGCFFFFFIIVRLNVSVHALRNKGTKSTLVTGVETSRASFALFVAYVSCVNILPGKAHEVH